MKIAESIDNMLLETSSLWTGPQNDICQLELLVRQTIGIALKSHRSEVYIERLMALSEESQEYLGAIVQTCLEAIYEGGMHGSRDSVTSGDDSMRGSEDGPPGSGRIGLRATVENPDDDIPIEVQQINVDERKRRDLQRAALLAERESLQLREKNTGLERDIAIFRTENDQLKAKVEKLEKDC